MCTINVYITDIHYLFIGQKIHLIQSYNIYIWTTNCKVVVCTSMYESASTALLNIVYKQIRCVFDYHGPCVNDNNRGKMHLKLILIFAINNTSISSDLER